MNEPSTASTPANGSAAPTNPVPMSRHPYAALRQSCGEAVGQRQQSPAADAGRSRSARRRARRMPRRVPSSTQRAARAEELQLVRATARPRPSRLRGGLAASARSSSGCMPQRRDRRPADGARRLQDAAGAGHPRAREHRGERRGQLARDRAGRLDEEQAHRPQQREREEGDPVQRHGHERARTTSRRCSCGCAASRVRDDGPRPAAIRLRARRRRCRRTRPAPRARRRRGARRGGRAPTRSRASSTVGRAGSNPPSARQTAWRTRIGRRVEAEHVAQAVVLPLVELVVDERRRSARGA